MEYQIDDKQLDASVFLSLVNQVWPNDYDVKQTERRWLPSHPYRWIFLRHDHRAAHPSCVSEARIR